jgi:hypothetical protein
MPTIPTILSWLDAIREWWVVFLCKFSLGRVVFTNKPVRVFLGFFVVLLASSTLFLLEPYWVLIVTPLIWGPVHLWASFRYSTSRNLIQSNLLFLSCFLFFTGFYFLRQHSQYLSEMAANKSILAAGLVTIFLCSAIYRAKWGSQFFLQLIALTACTAVLIAKPYEALITMLIGHNLIAFFYWRQFCHSQSQKMLWTICSLLTLVICGGISSGVFDPVLGMHAYKPWVLSLSSLFPVPSVVALRIVYIFAVTQSLHYFIWLRAIPEQDIAGRSPPGWRQSYRLLVRDLGTTGSKAAIATSSVIIALLLVISLASSAFKAYQVYIAIAGFHGFYEIGQLFASRRLV